MTNRSLSRVVCGLVLVIAASIAATAQAAAVAPGVDCGANACGWSINVDGSSVSSGYFTSDAAGNYVLAAPISFQLADGSSISLRSLSGNIDPVLAFSFSASTAATGKTFSVSYSVPIALSGPINANSQVSYSLTSSTSAGAQISPLFGNVVIAQEVDTTPGPGQLAPLNKGVDVGNSFFVAGGPNTGSSPVYSATNSFSGNLAYDLMSITVAFSLSPNSSVGLSGFVQQELAPVPLPAAAWLFGSGLLGLAGMRHRSLTV